MSVTYEWQIGFNWNSRTIEGTLQSHHLYPLQHGLVTPDATAAWSTEFCARDIFSFVLFDITPVLSPPGQPLAYTFPKFELAVTGSNNHLPANPFGLDDTNLPPSSSGKSTYDETSGVLTCPDGVWSESSQAMSPVFSVNNGMMLRRWFISQDPEGPGYEFQFQPGSEGDNLEISVLIEVESGGVHRKFVFDPQMKVGPAG